LERRKQLILAYLRFEKKPDWRRKMFFQVTPGMDEYLEPTELCDCSNPIIVNKSNELVGGSSTPKEAALKIFQFVKDEIPFKANRADERASETLQIGSGFCVTKSNLHVALLRAIGIPARYHHVHLRKEILIDGYPVKPCFRKSWFQNFLEKDSFQKKMSLI
jgi:transglutaminase-like putative cysteine protease